MSDELFDTYLKEAENTRFSGWNFQHFTDSNRLIFAPLKWNYYNVVLPYLRKAETLLDMGTGGGEVLSRFAPLPPNTYATESFEPNVAVARNALEPLGVQVARVDGDRYPNNEQLPYANEFFDVIINRHESFYPPELYRVLKSRGFFISQQVGLGLFELKKALTNQPEEKSDWDLPKVKRQLKSTGFKIIQNYEDYQSVRYFDIGAVAYHLKAIPWIIEGFTIDKYRDKLHELHLQIQKDGYFEDGYNIFIFITQKPGTLK